MLTDRERSRYQRQLVILGEDGQERLKHSRILIAGAGGLGSAVSLYLAAAGVGKLRVVDRDVVEVSNLNRQILHRNPGRRKADSAREFLEDLNPGVEVEALATSLDEDNALSLVQGCDIIIDALDGFQARYILNHAALKKGIPLVHGAIEGWHGQATTVIPGSCCLRCIFPRPPPSKAVPALGATCGVIGSIQAIEAMKILLGKGDLLEDRLLIWDGLAGSMDEVLLAQDPNCPECSDYLSRKDRNCGLDV